MAQPDPDRPPPSLGKDLPCLRKGCLPKPEVTQRAEREWKVLTDGEAVAIDAESGTPAFFEALFPVAGFRHGSAAGVPGPPRQSGQPSSVPSPGRATRCPRRSALAASGARQLQARGPLSQLSTRHTEESASIATAPSPMPTSRYDERSAKKG